MKKELQFLMYSTPENDIFVNAIIKDDTIWLTQKSMAELFGAEVPAISKHLTNIYAEGELQYQSTVSKMEIVQTEGKRQVKRNLDFYNLDAIISVGYRVSSYKATHFRIWATNILKEYTIKGFVIDDERLTTWKNAPDGRTLKSDVTIAKNYLDEKQIRRLERAITGYFDYVEDLIEEEHIFTMDDFAQSINEFLKFRKFKILTHKGNISKKQADSKAIAEYEEFNNTQIIESDFDKEVKKLLSKGGVGDD